jgi:AcrR family transcriptional regulator
MTEKKELILDTALKLFAQEGFDTTPTSKIAREAGVSEGLIFRHFGNKEGLMDSVVELCESRIEPHIEAIARLSDPKAQIQEIIDLTYVLYKEEREFWQLQFTIKWQQNYKPERKKNSPNFKRLMQIGTDAFQKLGYAEPEKEIALLALLMEGFGTMMIKESNQAVIESTLDFIKSKY